MVDLISRKEAIGNGGKFYFTGKACPRGHVVDRRVTTGKCTSCEHEMVREWRNRIKDDPGFRQKKADQQRAIRRARNPDGEKISARRKLLAALTREERERLQKEYRRRWFEDNRDRVYACGKAWRENNEQRYRKRLSEACRRHKHLFAARNAKRRAAKVCATPPWSDLPVIRGIYKQSRQITEETGVRHHVDHIVPLISPVVCGLHVSWNLRVIPAKINHIKGNRLVEVAA